MAVWGGLTNSCEKQGSRKYRRKGKIYPFECRVPKRRDKKVFLSDQCKEIQENSRVGKTKDLFKKISDTKGTFHTKMGTIKDRNGMDLTEADKRWLRRTIQRRSSWPRYPDVVITHLEPDILECKVKWALGSITVNKAGGGDGIPTELFQTLKDDAVKVLHSKCCKFGKLSSGHRTGKGQFSKSQRRQCQTLLKLLHNCTHLTH